MTKKSQFEIMGIAVIVVILILGMLIFFVLNQNQRQENIIKTYSNTEFAQNFIEVYLKTTTDCGKRSAGELVMACAKGSAITCSDGLTSCAKAAEVAQVTLDATVKTYNKQYGFKAAKISGELSGRSQSKSNRQNIL